MQVKNPWEKSHRERESGRNEYVGRKKVRSPLRKEKVRGNILGSLGLMYDNGG